MTEYNNDYFCEYISARFVLKVGSIQYFDNRLKVVKLEVVFVLVKWNVIVCYHMV